MFWIDETFYIFDEQPNRIAFIADTPADIANLPTSHHEGTQQGDNNVSLEPVNPGSVVFIISTSDVYMLNSVDEWVLQPKKGGGGGGGGASRLSQLEDVSLSTPRDGDFLVYDPVAGAWINKEANTVVVNYTMIDNKPTINGVTIDGDITSEDLGLENPLTPEQLDSLLDLI